MNRRWKTSSIQRPGGGFAGQAALLLTSPPFPLRRQKKYGNLEGDEYLHWIRDIFSRASMLLSASGSMVIEVGNSWDPGLPTMSTLPLRALLSVAEGTGFSVCQQFICHNPSSTSGPGAVGQYRAQKGEGHLHPRLVVRQGPVRPR